MRMNFVEWGAREKKKEKIEIESILETNGWPLDEVSRDRIRMDIRG